MAAESSPPAKRNLLTPLCVAVAIGALVFASILQLEVLAIHSEGAGLGSRQLFARTINVTHDLEPGNASAGYWGTTSFGSPVGNGNALALSITFTEPTRGAPAVTLEYVICTNPQICSYPGGALSVVPVTPGLSETLIDIVPATGSYSMGLFNLPGYADGAPVVPLAVLVNVTLLGQVNFHS